jgi:hypothetical protein
MPGPRADQLSQQGATQGDVLTAGSQVPAFEAPTGGGGSGWRLLHTGVFAAGSGDIDADTDAPSFSGDFQAWDHFTAVTGAGEAAVYYEGRLAPTETEITEIQIPIKGSGQFRLKVWVEGATGIGNIAYESGLVVAPTLRTVYSLSSGTELIDQPVGEGRYFVIVEAVLDSTEELYAGRPFVNHT